MVIRFQLNTVNCAGVTENGIDSRIPNDVDAHRDSEMCMVHEDVFIMS